MPLVLRKHKFSRRANFEVDSIQTSARNKTGADSIRETGERAFTAILTTVNSQLRLLKAAAAVSYQNAGQARSLISPTTARSFHFSASKNTSPSPIRAEPEIRKAPI